MRTHFLIKIIAILILGSSFYSCVEKYWPEIDNTNQELLVVDGMISNQAGPYTIKISRTSSVENPEYLPLTNYRVEILDDLGNSESLTETEEGIYKTSQNGIQGIVGRSYKLILNSPDGKIYESKFQKILVPIEIEKVSANWETKQDTSMSHNKIGYQFYINSHEFIQDDNYIMWKVQQTYKYKANHVLTYIYDNHQVIQMNDIDSLRVCWKTSTIDEIYTFKNIGSAGTKLNNYPLNFVSTEGKELSIRYSLLVQQLSISSKAYNYLTSLNNQNSGDASIYVQQPYQLSSNIINIDNPNEVVLGYFNVAGISQKRIFVDRPTEIFYYQPKCVLNFDAVAYLHLSVPSEWPFYFTPDSLNFEGLVDKGCVDCRVAGGKLEEPVFWVNKY